MGTTESEPRVGFIAAKYESGESKTDAGTIANTKGDPGGKSYGVYQLSIRAGTLRRYVEQSKYRNRLLPIPLGSKEFDVEWMTLADTDLENFEKSQHEFILKTHYLPAIAYAKNQGFSIDARAVQEAVFSISVQHGGYRVVINNARRLKTSKAVSDQVKALYEARTNYVKSLNTLSDPIKEAVLNRYVREVGDVLTLV